MKILIVGNGSIGVSKDGSRFVNSHTGKFLSDFGCKFDICFVEPGKIYSENNNLQSFDLIESDVRYEVLPNAKSLCLMPRLLRLLFGYDFVYLFYPGSMSRLFAFFAIIFGRSYGLYVRGQYYGQGTVDKLILRRAKFITTVSPSIKEDVSRFCDNVAIIKPMFSIGVEDFKSDRIYLRKGFWRFLFVGRVEYRKGIFELLEIIKILKENGLDLVLDVVGGGDSILEVEEYIEKNNLVGDVIVHGLVSDREALKSLYDGSDIFVYTSHDEGFPRVLYEAMASALPIFTTFVGGIPGRMTDGVNCFEIPAKDPSSAASVILDRLRRSSDFKKLGENGQKTLSNILNGELLDHSEVLVRMVRNEKKD